MDNDDPFVNSQSFSLAKAIDILFEKIQSEDVSGAIPAHDAFEVEDLTNRQNFVFIKREDTVDLYDTSRDRNSPFGFSKHLMKTFGPDFPFDAKSAEEYYLYMYRKALKAEDNICFIGYVLETDDSFDPIEENDYDSTSG